MSRPCRSFWEVWRLAFLAICGACIARADTLPARPTAYFTDQAGVVSATDAQALNHQLAEFERQTSNQILVVVYPQMDSASSIEDYTVRTAQKWQVGQKGRNNGAVLFVFPKDRRMYIQVGYGLEGALPDAICSEIINRQIKPHFQAGDYAGGLSAGVSAMIAAAQGEYRGSGTTQGERQQGSGSAPVNPPVIVFFVVLMLIAGWFNRRRQNRIWPGSSRGGFGGGPWLGGGGGGGGSNDSFSSGGGSFGGGGAGGNW